MRLLDEKRMIVKVGSEDFTPSAAEGEKSYAGLSWSETLGEDPETRSTCQSPWRRIDVDDGDREPGTGDRRISVRSSLLI